MYYVRRSGQADRAHIIVVIVTAGEVTVNHAVFGRGGVDELTIADIDACMGASLAKRAAGVTEKVGRVA